MRALCGWIAYATVMACLAVCTVIPVRAQSGAPRNGEWPTWGGDLGNTRYSPLDQINAGNFSNLQIAWRFNTDHLGPTPEYRFETTPLMVNGVLYTTAGSRRDVVALDAATGEELWVHRENEGERAAAAPRKLSGRGLAYWSNGKGDDRILYVTIGYRLVCLNAKTGAPISTFGEDGIVDLKKFAVNGTGQPIDLKTGEIGLHAAPTVTKSGIILVGSAFLGGNGYKTHNNTKGMILAFDVHTGKNLWRFNTIPRPGEFGNNTWLNNSWAVNGNAGVWTQISVDEDLGLAYLPVEMPTGDYYGGDRPGNGLFGNTLVAVDLKTGKRKWYFQEVHHDMWDMDIAAPPLLMDITISGQTVKAVASPSKQGFLYVFNRETGKPIWPIEECPVPKGDVPTEWYSPTQPCPTKPPAYNMQGVTTDDLIDFTPELHAEAVKFVANYKIGPLFTPPVVSKASGPLGTIEQPSDGSNWPGGSYDPETHTFYIFSAHNPRLLGLVPPRDSSVSDMEYIPGVAGGGRHSLTIQGLPLLKPPYGSINAINMDKGEILWQVPHGDTPDSVRNNPALKGIDIPPTGNTDSQATTGILVTKTLLIAGEGEVTTKPSGMRGASLIAYDKQTGKRLGSVFMPAPETGGPMTYMLNGKQYIVVAVSGGKYSGELIAFRLPD